MNKMKQWPWWHLWLHGAMMVWGMYCFQGDFYVKFLNICYCLHDGCWSEGVFILKKARVYERTKKPGSGWVIVL